MRWLALALTLVLPVLAGCAASAPKQGGATYNADGTVTVTVSAKRAAECKTNGGCGLFSRAELAGLANAAAKYGAKTCRSGTSL